MVSDLTKKIVEKITDEIGKGETYKKTQNGSNKKLKDKRKKDDTKINNPELSFIFTIALGGKIDISNEIEKSIQQQNKSIKRKENQNQDIRSRVEFFREKEIMFSQILNQEKQSSFIYKGLQESEMVDIQNITSKEFIKDAVFAIWQYNALNNNRHNYILTKTKKRYLENGGDAGRLPNEIIRLTNSFTVYVKLFSVGAISILIKNEQPAVYNSNECISMFLKEITDSIKYPNSTNTQNGFIVNSSNIKNNVLAKKETSGFLNIFTHDLASHVFNEFFRCLSNEKNGKLRNLLKISKVCQSSTKSDLSIVNRFERGLYTNKKVKALISEAPNCKKLSDRVNFSKDAKGKFYIEYSGDPLEHDEHLLYKQFSDNKDDLISLLKMFALIKEPPKNNETDLPKELLKFYLENQNPNNPLEKFLIKKEVKNIAGMLCNAPLFVTPFIGVKFDNIPEKYMGNGLLKYPPLNLFSTTSTSPLKSLDISDNSKTNLLPASSIINNQVYSMAIERNGVTFVDNSVKKKKEKQRILQNSSSLFSRSYDALIFCLESTIATTKALSYFNKELEEEVSYKFNNILNKRLSNSWITFYRNKPITYFGIIAGLVFFLFASGISAIANCCMTFFIMLHMASILRNYHINNKLNCFINKANSLSTYNDSSYNITNAITSEIVLKGVELVKGFSLNPLINLVKNRLKTFKKTLENIYSPFILQANWIFISLVLYMGIINLIFSNNFAFSWQALIKTFGINVTTHESLMQFLKNLIF